MAVEADRVATRHLRAARRSAHNQVEHFREWLAGLKVALGGNRIAIDGCRFDIDADCISTRAKSHFASENYERPEREAVRRFLDPTLPVVEFGGSIGVVSCIVNRRLSDPTKHVVVEANPPIAALLERNRELNGCRFEIVRKVVGYGGEQAVFFANNTCFLGSSTVLHPDAADVEDIDRLELATTGLRRILDEHGFQACTLICDIEGAEAQLLAHEADVIAAAVQTIIIEVHPFFLGQQTTDRLLAGLRDLGFDQRHVDGDTYVFVRKDAPRAAA